MFKKLVASTATLLTLSTLFVTSAFAAQNWDGSAKAEAFVDSERAYGNIWAVGTGAISTSKADYYVDQIRGTLILYEDGSAVGSDTDSASSQSDLDFSVREEVNEANLYHSLMSGYVSYEDGSDSDSPKAETGELGIYP